VDDADAVQQVVHALLDHRVDLLQRLQHLPLLKRRHVVLLQQSVHRQVRPLEIFEGVELLVVDIPLDLGHFLPLAANQAEEVLLEGVDDQLLVLQLVLQRTHLPLLILAQLVPQRHSLALPPLSPLPLGLLAQLQHQRGHLLEVRLHAVLARHQLEQQLRSLHLVRLQLYPVVRQLVAASVGSELLTESLELIQLDGGGVHLF
jgi:hypothetical protein